jgi:hypothetical protein
VTRRRRYLALAGGCLVVFLTLDAGPPALLAAVLGVLGLLAWTVP